MNDLAENEDYYFDENGYMVFTGKYLLNRGMCCGNGCKNCPYDYINVPEELRFKFLADNETRKEDHINQKIVEKN